MANWKLTRGHIWTIWFLFLLAAYLFTALSIAYVITTLKPPILSPFLVFGCVTWCVGILHTLYIYNAHRPTDLPPAWPCWTLVAYLLTTTWIHHANVSVAVGCIAGIVTAAGAGVLATTYIRHILKLTFKTCGFWILILLLYSLFTFFTLWNQWPMSSAALIVAFSFFILFIYHYVTKQAPATRLMASTHAVYIGLVCVYPVLFCADLYCQAVTLAAAITIFNIGAASVLVALYDTWKNTGKGVATYLLLQGLVLFIYIISAEIILYYSVEKPLLHASQHVFVASIVLLTVLHVWQGYNSTSLWAGLCHTLICKYLAVVSGCACATLALRSDGWVLVALATLVCIALLISAIQIAIVIHIHKAPRRINFMSPSGRGTGDGTSPTWPIARSGRTTYVAPHRSLPPLPPLSRNTVSSTPTPESPIVYTTAAVETSIGSSIPITYDTSTSRDLQDSPQGASALLGNTISGALTCDEQMGGPGEDGGYEDVYFPTR
ncbi:RF15 [Retroperitoneal fibromatosis-associated herpesvirus]|uniref:RF15 n=1 Tax=Retroperitoneal fibromatosis-associated herpesvirus TaxID=111469 RepID=U5NJ10_9GAMA|nr:RF15 [Retroperitoneal fibromatosis-associated herpesvirus]AGY30764.1 RF15 [Retroperitoneal fibromatosis-associated herpesvirus]